MCTDAGQEVVNGHLLPESISALLPPGVTFRPLDCTPAPSITILLAWKSGNTARLVREFVTDIRVAQNLLVVKTAVGSAQPVAAALDAESWPEAIGTVAGDDTILIVTPDNKASARLAQRIRGMLA